MDGKIYVLGSGTVRPLKEYVFEIQQIVNPTCKIKFGAIPYSNNQVMHLQADISELNCDTGFSPVISFDNGIREILQYDFQIRKTYK